MWILFCHVFGHIDICGLYLPCTIPLPAQYNIETGKIQEQAMAITSLDILNLSHSLKDVCEVNCKTPECLSQTLQVLLEYNPDPGQSGIQPAVWLPQCTAGRPIPRCPAGASQGKKRCGIYSL